MITQEILKTLLNYDPDTGIFTRKIDRGTQWKAGSVAGAFHTSGYLQISLQGKIYLSHRLAWLYVYGVFPPDQLDHVNCNRADNRIANLRLCSNAQNSQNRTKKNMQTSGRIGVCWDGSKKKWLAYIMLLGVQKNLGRFSNLSDAIEAREAGEFQYHTFNNAGIAQVSQ